MAYILVGGIPGFSCGILNTVCNVVLLRYFQKRRMLALGLTQAGSAVGTLALAPLLQYLIDLYGWQGAFLLLGGLSFNSVAASTLYRPIRLKTDETGNEERSNGMLDFLRTAKWCLSRSKFLLFPAIFVVMYSGLRAYLSFLIPFARRELLLDPMQSSFLLSLYSVVNIFSRTAFGALGDNKRVNIVWVLLVTQLIIAAITALVWFVGTYAGLLANTVAHSLMSGCIHVFYIPLLVEVVGENKIQWGIALAGLLYGIFGSGVVPLIGLMVDSVGDIKLAFLASAALWTLSVFLHFPLLRNRPARLC